MMRRAVVLAAVLVWATQAHGATVSIKDNHLTFNGKSYFRCSSEDMVLGTYGEKKTPLTKCNYVSRYGDILAKNIAKTTVTHEGPFVIDWASTSETDFAGDFDYKYYNKDGSVSAAGSYSKSKSANLQLMKFSISPSTMETVLNNYAGTARTYLKDEGSDARVVLDIWVVVSAELAAEVNSSTTVSAKYSSGDANVEISLTVGSGHTYTLSLAPGTTFAYLPWKVSDWNSGKTKVEDLEDDQWSLS